MNSEHEIKSQYRKLISILSQISIFPEKKETLNKVAEELRQNIQQLAITHPIDQERISKNIVFQATQNSILLHILQHPELNDIISSIEKIKINKTIIKKNKSILENILREINIDENIIQKIIKLQEFINIKIDKTFLIPGGKYSELKKDLQWILSEESSQHINSYNFDANRFRNSIKNLKNKSIDELIDKYQKINKNQ